MHTLARAVKQSEISLPVTGISLGMENLNHSTTYKLRCFFFVFYKIQSKNIKEKQVQKKRPL